MRDYSIFNMLPCDGWLLKVLLYLYIFINKFFLLSKKVFSIVSLGINPNLWYRDKADVLSLKLDIFTYLILNLSNASEVNWLTKYEVTPIFLEFGFMIIFPIVQKSFSIASIKFP